MIYRLIMPGPIEDTSELRVLQWHAVPGGALAPGELLVELETHKVVIEVRAGRPCVMRQILCEEAGWHACGVTLALLSDDSEEPLPADVPMLPQYEADLEII